MSISLVTLNIEGHHHLDRFLPFLLREKPDVICLQEVFAADIPQLERVLGMNATFAPMMSVETENKYRIAPLGEWGVVFLTRLTHTEPTISRYSGEGERLPIFSENPNDPWRMVIQVVVEKEGLHIPIATTHFTWSPEGKTTDLQRRDCAALLDTLKSHEQLVLCGDFNAPRGGELRATLATTFTDTIPDEVLTTLDPLLHYAGPLNIVVDGIFAKGVVVEDVRVTPGLSDHQAVSAVVTGLAV